MNYRSTTEFDDLVVFGARSHALLLLSGIEEVRHERVRVRAFVDELENGFLHPNRGLPVISMEDRRQAFPDVPVLLGVGDGALRQRVMAQLAQEGATFASFVGRGAPRVDPSIKIGAGVYLQPDVRAGANITVGEGAQVLCDCLGHDVEVGAFATLGISSTVLGHVYIGRGAYIAPRAVIKNGTREKPVVIGEDARVGVGAVVIRDVPQGASVMGNPAMPIMAWRRYFKAVESDDLG